MRAATTLVPQLQAAEQAAVAAAAEVPAIKRSTMLNLPAGIWRADEFDDAIHQSTGAAVAASGFAALDAELPGGGWPQGRLIELLLDDPGVGELSLVLPAVAQVARSGRACVWVLPHDRDEIAYPPALAAAGLEPARHIFVKPATPRESLWAVEQSLRAAHLGALVAWLPGGSGMSVDADFRALRRLQLLAQRQRMLVFVLRAAAAAAAPSPATVRLQLASRSGQLQVTMLKRRGRPLLDPVSLQVWPAHWNVSPAIAVPARPIAAADDAPAPNATSAATDTPDRSRPPGGPAATVGAKVSTARRLRLQYGARAGHQRNLLAASALDQLAHHVLAPLRRWSMKAMFSH